MTAERFLFLARRFVSGLNVATTTGVRFSPEARRTKPRRRSVRETYVSKTRIRPTQDSVEKILKTHTVRI